LPMERRQRLVVLLSNLIQQHASMDREASHECGTDPARLGVAGENPRTSLRSPGDRLRPPIDRSPG
jgi:hypothetical protein